MKFIIALVVAVAFVCVNGASLTDDQKKIDEYAQACAKETGIDNEAAKKLKVGDISANDKNAPCFVKCIAERTGALDKNGVLQKDVFIRDLSFKDPSAKKEALEAWADKCSQEKGTDSCDTAFKVYKCYWGDAIKA